MGRTQDALYDEIDLELSWSERELPERERTKHVHRLHPYLGKFIPAARRDTARSARAGGRPRARPVRGLGNDARPGARERTTTRPGPTSPPSTACSCASRRAATTCSCSSASCATCSRRLERARSASRAMRPPYARGRGSRRRRLDELLRFRSLLDEYEHADVLRVVLARAARSARLTPHFDLDFPRAPQRGEYWCHKHRRVCRPVERAAHFLRRYGSTRSPGSRLSRGCGRAAARRMSFTATRASSRSAGRSTGSSRRLRIPALIDYHGSIAMRTSCWASTSSTSWSSAARPEARGLGAGCLLRRHRRVLRERPAALRPGAPVVIVVNDRRDLYPGDPRARGPPPGGALPTPRQPAHGPAGGRVLRGRARRDDRLIRAGRGGRERGTRRRRRPSGRCAGGSAAQPARPAPARLDADPPARLPCGRRARRTRTASGWSSPPSSIVPAGSIRPA